MALPADGDDKARLAIRATPQGGVWFIIHSSTGTSVGFQWGSDTDIPAELWPAYPVDR